MKESKQNKKVGFITFFFENKNILEFGTLIVVFYGVWWWKEKGGKNT